MASHYRFAFWNLENLFDIEGSPRREEKVARAIGSSIKGWTQALLDRKISQLAGFIKTMNGGRGPDILGVCEVENRFVLDLLVQALSPLRRNYSIAHHDTQDNRGIDVAFIYDNKKFVAEATFNHFLMRRNATRDILQVNFITRKNRRFVLMGNHWPARSGGVLESAPYRAMAGETLAYFHERIIEIHGKKTPVLAMGDFNDEPFDVSLVDYALAARTEQKVIGGSNPYFFNLTWPLMGKGEGTYYYDGTHNFLDQILVNKYLLDPASPIKIKPSSVKILRPTNALIPVPFGGMGKKINQNGFSDHFAIEAAVTEED